MFKKNVMLVLGVMVLSITMVYCSEPKPTGFLTAPIKIYAYSAPDKADWGYIARLREGETLLKLRQDNIVSIKKQEKAEWVKYEAVLNNGDIIKEKRYLGDLEALRIPFAATNKIFARLEALHAER